MYTYPSSNEGWLLCKHQKLLEGELGVLFELTSAPVSCRYKCSNISTTVLEINCTQLLERLMLPSKFQTVYYRTPIETLPLEQVKVKISERFFEILNCRYPESKSISEKYF